jgi:hyperosmotically inducible periplasmic protein
MVMKNSSKFIQCSVLACGLVAFSQASGPTTALGAQKQQVKTAVEKTKEGAEKVGSKTKEGAEKAGSKTKEALSSTGEVITDAWITSRVKTRFIGEDALKDSHINVDTNDHVVTLKGTVLSAAGRSRAIAIAKDTEGVHKVVDRLTIGPKR